MNRHYWPTEQGEYVLHLEPEDQIKDQATLKVDGLWHFPECSVPFSSDDLKEMGYLGVRTPFDEEAERAAFEAVFPLPQDHDEMDLHVQFEQWRAWLAAKRHERGL